ncbi:ABC transporter ATP-binding protein [Kitasatospora viridis]|uniref:ABC-2 type transport system ATP-binding protein n=1 Tax=Kitasatospora viridis TaxID=281105 RepID=A0A561TTB3_9ACTN|nr:ABC transporter ATP-binding protein [Kitasatospora viridis]TWF90345.1 ABC-2 type transport system ATP-binding protein [Kitasatospora viridis]
MTPPVLEAVRLTHRYGRHTALADCELSLPPGRIVGLVGPNGAGKSTLLNLACGLARPTSGTIRVLGAVPAADPAHLARVGFVAQDTPVYRELSVAEHLHLGERLNPRWDGDLARRRVDRAGLDPRQRAGRLSGGQRAQLALALAAGKRPELLILDEPAAALDPVARATFLEHLVESVEELGATALLSSHALADVEQVCDHLVVLADGQVQLAGDTAELLARHRRILLPVPALAQLPDGVRVIHSDADEAIVRADPSLLVDGPWQPVAADLPEVVLAYLTAAASDDGTAAGSAYGRATTAAAITTTATGATARTTTSKGATR